MPYLTPDEIPEGDDCRPLSIPASSDWLAIVSGALTELTKTWNWEQQGSVTVDEAVARMQLMVDDYYMGGCGICTTPGGYRIIRIGSGGELEELVNNVWVEPTGEYVIPAPEPREGGTAEDQICLAAANATNVLEQLYESLAESWADNLSEAEALTDFIALLIALVGFEFAPIAWAIAAFFFVVFRLLYTALEYLGADLWDEAFSNQMICFLVNCGSNDAGVVTFDWDCFNDQLNSLADGFELSEVQLRLYLQVGFMLNFIGGVDGLNLAGRTTAITEFDCSICEDQCVYEDAFDTSTLGLLTHNAQPEAPDFTVVGDLDGGTAEWQSSNGTGGIPGWWKSVGTNPDSGDKNVCMIVEFEELCTITQASMWYLPQTGARTTFIIMRGAAQELRGFQNFSSGTPSTIDGWALAEYTGSPATDTKYVIFYSSVHPAQPDTGIDLIRTNI